MAKPSAQQWLAPTPDADESVPTAGELQVVTGELGITGTANFSGDVLSETNPNLYHQAGYGQPGARNWGAWEYVGKTDPDIASAIEFVLGQVRDAVTDIEEPGPAQKDRAIAAKQTEFLRWAILERLEPGFANVLLQMARGILPGFALHELVWGNVNHDSLPGGVGWSVTRLAERLPVSITTNGWVEADGDLSAVRQMGTKTVGATAQWATVEIPAEKLQLFTWNREGNNYLGTSAFRSVYYLTRIREQLLRIVGISYIREGAGVPVASSTDKDATLTPKQRKSLFKLLANLVFHENAAAVMPAGWRLDWIYSAGANKGHVIDAWRALGEVILRQVGAQQMVLGVNGTGSRSVGEVHDARAEQFIAGLLSAIEATANGIGSRKYSGLVRKIVDSNWGPQPAYPRLRVTTRKASLSILDRTAAMKVAREAGFLTPSPEDENDLRKELGMKLIDSAVRFESGAPPPPARQSAGVELRAAASRKVPFVPWRPLRASEKSIDLQAMVDFIDGQRAAFDKALRPVVLRMLVRAIPAIEKSIADGDATDIAQVEFDTANLEQTITKLAESIRAEGKRQTLNELRRGTGERVAETRREGGILSASVGDEPKQLKGDLIKRIAKAAVRRIASRVYVMLEDAAIEALRTGGDAADIASAAASMAGEEGEYRGAAGFVTAKIWNMGRAEGAAMMNASKAEYSAILDGKQCTPCQDKDGQVFEIDSPEYEAELPPNRDCEGGDNCRCMFVYLPDSAEEE